MGFGDVVEVRRAEFDASPEEEVEIQHVILFHFRSAFVPSSYKEASSTYNDHQEVFGRIRERISFRDAGIPRS